MKAEKSGLITKNNAENMPEVCNLTPVIICNARTLFYIYAILYCCLHKPQIGGANFWSNSYIVSINYRSFIIELNIFAVVQNN